MKYKKQIDAIRDRQKLIEANLDLICDDIRVLAFRRTKNTEKELNELLSEHQYNIELFKAEEELIASLQPWYRRLFGMDY